MYHNNFDQNEKMDYKLYIFLFVCVCGCGCGCVNTMNFEYFINCTIFYDI